MKSFFVRALVTAAALAALAFLARADKKEEFRFFMVPGADSTTPRAISSNGAIVGICGMPVGQSVFVYSGSSFETFQYPLATSSHSNGNGINSRGDIVGSYANDADPPDPGNPYASMHGFIRSGGVFTPINFPEARATTAMGINDSGEIVGIYWGAGTSHGFLLSGETYTSIDVPGARNTVAAGISASGVVIGHYTPAGGGYQTFLWQNGVFTFPAVPVTMSGINARGEIVGNLPGGNIQHPYIWKDGWMVSFDVPGAAYQWAAGINASGEITGSAQVAGVNLGFVRR